MTRPQITRSIGDRPEVEPRKGDVGRVTWQREAHGYCNRCDRSFDNCGAAASHARSARHRVTVHYSSTFAFVPNELRGAR